MRFTEISDVAQDKYIYTLEITGLDLSSIQYDEHDRFALRELAKDESVEARLMALQIMVRKIEQQIPKQEGK